MTTELRLEKLESELKRERRLNRWLLIGLCLIAGGWFVFSFGKTKSAEATNGGGKLIQADTVIAKSFIVNDEQGKPRAMLELSPDGPSLVMYDDQGIPRAMLSVVNSVPALVLADKKARMRAVFAVEEDGSILKMSNEKENKLLVLSAGKRPSLILYDDKGNPRAMLFGSTLRVSGETGEDVAALRVDKKGPILLMRGEKGVIWKAP